MTSSTSKASNTQGILLLVVTTLIWGSSFAITKHVVSSLSPAVLVTGRITLAAVVFAPFLRHFKATLIRDGFLLGVVYFIGFLTITTSLETTSANRAAFIVSLNAVFVPLLAALFQQRLPIKVFLAAGLAVLGVWVMSWEGQELNIGDGWALLCALIYAVYILMLGAISARHAPLSLTAVQLWVMAGLSLVWASPHLMAEAPAIAHNFAPLLYLALVNTAITTLTQAIAQRWISAHETALIYTLEPIFAALFSFLLLGEQFGIRGMMGAGLVLAAMVLSQRGGGGRMRDEGGRMRDEG
jgi:drug/metabolite transporter (DMT)-like permease